MHYDKNHNPRKGTETLLLNNVQTEVKHER